MFTRNEDYAYAAGLVDGEGCIRIDISTKGYYSIRVVVALTVTEPINWLHDNFGGRIYVKTKTKERYKEAWVWVVTGKEARSFLDKILPIMKVKFNEAVYALLAHESHSKEIKEFLRKTCSEEKRFNS